MNIESDPGVQLVHVVIRLVVELSRDVATLEEDRDLIAAGALWEDQL